MKVFTRTMSKSYFLLSIIYFSQIKWETWNFSSHKDSADESINWDSAVLKDSYIVLVTLVLETNIGSSILKRTRIESLEILAIACLHFCTKLQYLLCLIEPTIYNFSLLVNFLVLRRIFKSFFINSSTKVSRNFL